MTQTNELTRALPVRFARPSEDSAHRLRHGWDLLVELVRRDLRFRYKRSVLGIGWSLLNPFLQLLIFTVVFRNIFHLQIEHFPTFVFCGLIAWTWFSSALLLASTTILDSPELVRRPGFPVGALPILNVTSNAIPFVLSFPVLFLFMLFDGLGLGIQIVLLPVIMAIQFVLTLGLTCLIASSNVRFRDTQHLVGVAIMFGFYLTPVFYSDKSIPAAYRVIFQLNPMAVLLKAYRNIIIEHRWPDMPALGGVLALGCLLLFVGYRVFDRTRARFAEEI